MDPAQRIRIRNTAFVQTGVAIACVIVAVLLVYVDRLPRTMTGLPGALLALGLIATWMLRRGWRGFRAIGVRPTRLTTSEGRVRR